MVIIIRMGEGGWGFMRRRGKWRREIGGGRWVLFVEGFSKEDLFIVGIFLLPTPLSFIPDNLNLQL